MGASPGAEGMKDEWAKELDYSVSSKGWVDLAERILHGMSTAKDWNYLQPLF